MLDIFLHISQSISSICSISQKKNHPHIFSTFILSGSLFPFCVCLCGFEFEFVAFVCTESDRASNCIIILSTLLFRTHIHFNSLLCICICIFVCLNCSIVVQLYILKYDPCYIMHLIS